MNKLFRNRDTNMIIKDIHHMKLDDEFVSLLFIYILLRRYASLSGLFELENSYAFFLLTRIFWSNKDVK
jgi:hypothetical protein